MQTHFHWLTEREKRILAERNPHWPKREREIVIIIVVDFSLLRSATPFSFYSSLQIKRKTSMKREERRRGIRESSTLFLACRCDKIILIQMKRSKISLEENAVNQFKYSQDIFSFCFHLKTMIYLSNIDVNELSEQFFL